MNFDIDIDVFFVNSTYNFTSKMAGELFLLLLILL